MVEKNGLWFKNANLESLKTAMRRLEDNEFLATLSKASYEKLEFSQEAYINCMERYWLLYDHHAVFPDVYLQQLL